MSSVTCEVDQVGARCACKLTEAITSHFPRSGVDHLQSFVSSTCDQKRNLASTWNANHARF